MTIDPTSTHTLGHAHVSCFGKAPHDINWRLNDLQTTGDLENPRNLLLFARLSSIASAVEISTMYSPRVANFNALLAEPEYYTHTITHGEFPLNLHRGAAAAGMEIPRGCALFLHSADCPTVIIVDPIDKRVVAAHAGLGELIKFSSFDVQAPHREHESVIDLMIGLFPEAHRERLLVKSVCGIDPAMYTHPTSDPRYGASNHMLIEKILGRWGQSCIAGNQENGRINLHQLILEQVASLGVSKENVSDDGVDTYSDMLNHQYCWWSHRRATHAQNNVGGRNGTLVVNSL